MPSHKKHFGYIPTPARIFRDVEKLNVQVYGEEYLEFTDLPNYKEMAAEDLPDLALPYKSVLKFYPKFGETEPQKTGDCTSHATRGAAVTSYAYEIDILGEAEKWMGMFCTETIYGARGHSGQGMNPGIATMFLINEGILLRKKYDFADLSSYNWKVGHNWGRSGVPANVRKLCKEHPCKYHLRIRSEKELMVALAHGYGVHFGSKIGVANKRGPLGRNRWTENWNHDMQIGGYHRDHKGDVWNLHLNTWGIWNSGPHPEFGKIPGGSFMLSMDDFNRALRGGGECWAVGNVQGFPTQKMKDYGTGDFL